jgi:hypothetical protein
MKSEHHLQPTDSSKAHHCLRTLAIAGSILSTVGLYGTAAILAGTGLAEAGASPTALQQAIGLGTSLATSSQLSRGEASQLGAQMAQLVLSSTAIASNPGDAGKVPNPCDWNILGATIQSYNQLINSSNPSILLALFKSAEFRTLSNQIREATGTSKLVDPQSPALYPQSLV